MNNLLDFIILFVKQFAGGPGPVENNLVRFGLPAAMWAVLFFVAWSRQHDQDLPRERLLVWGFGLAFLREFYMFIQMVRRLMSPEAFEVSCQVVQPFEHALAMAAMTVVAGAYLRYALGNPRISQVYVRVGLAVTAAVFIFSSITWPAQMASNPQLQFHQTQSAWYFHVPLSIMLGGAVLMLLHRREWLRIVVGVALFFYLLSEMLLLFNYATDRTFNSFVCPVGNMLHILVVPLLGYIYLKEQSIEKKQAEADLIAYRDHLEELVSDRTAKLTMVNERLEREVDERTHAEEQLEKRNRSLAAQNAVAASLSQSLDIERNISDVLEIVKTEMQMEVGLIFLLEQDGRLELRFQSGLGEVEEKSIVLGDCFCARVSRAALERLEVVVFEAPNQELESSNPCLDIVAVRSLVSVPVVSKGSVAGVMTLGARAPAVVLPHQLELLRAAGQQIGMALENMRLFRHAQARSQKLVRLNAASSQLNTSIDRSHVTTEIARQSAWLLGCNQACVLAMDKSGENLVLLDSFGLDRGEVCSIRKLLPHILKMLLSERSSRRIFPGDPPEVFGEHRVDGPCISLRDALLIPIWRSELPEEFILVLSGPEERRWHPLDIEMIELLANRAAIALVNANLHAQIEVSAALEERQRIAADMHDGLAQTMSLLGLQVDRAQVFLHAGEESKAEESIHGLRDAISAAAEEIRESIIRLQETPGPRSSLQDRIRNLLNRLNLSNEVRLVFINVSERDLYVNPAEEVQVLPIVQEAVINALNHAKADWVVVQLSQPDTGFRITVEDNGIGFDKEAASKIDGHFGLSIMHARAARLGGVLEVESHPDQGTRIVFSWQPAGLEMPDPLLQEV